MSSAPFVADSLAGTTWYSGADDAARLPLVTALVSRFNHDLRTPLNTLAGWTHLLHESASDTARTQHVSEVFARSIRDETTLLEEFVDDVRSLLNGLVLNPVEVAAEALLREATERLWPMLEIHDVLLDRSGDVDGALVTMDRTRAARLLYRLLLAAVRRAPAGATVDHQVGTTNGCLSLEVDAPSLRSTFDDALLLDLRVSSALTALMGGVLEVGTPGSGSHFRLQLPIGALHYSPLT